ncbi:MAG: ABC transporter permease subunit [Nitrospinae bacterium]|nr:ABC transporter permease subunit [Nitrospinota bacterium]
MNNFVTLFKKEFFLFFTSPVAYAIITIFMLMAGFFFYNIFAYYSVVSQQIAMQGIVSGSGGINVTEGILIPFHMNISVVVLLLIPLITMRSFSEEKKNGTFELLMTYPIKDYEVVLGKFFAAFAFYGVLITLTLIYPLIVSVYASIELPVLISSLLGLLLMGAAFIAVGILISSLTENQIIAGGLTFGVCLIFWLLGWMETEASPEIGTVLKHLSLIEHFQNFSKGTINTKDIVYYFDFIILMLFLTLRNLDSNKWRG